IDCAHAPEFVPRLRSCRIVEDGRERRLVEHRVQILRVLPALTYCFEERLETGKRIDFRRVSGALREMEGSWSLEDDAGRGTLVRYEVVLDPGFAVPGWLVRRLLRHDLVELLAALRDRVERGGAAHGDARR
ncbi:MAG TPA: SRPBCC family protein, partial [Thermoanaerobaculia bacterium]